VVSDSLDGSNVMGETPYVLEVTSPGVDRPLTEPRHWRRAAGRLVQAPTAEGGSLTGRVLGADDDGVTFDLGGHQRAVLYAELGAGRIQVEFNREEDLS
jgi:ribosome maturation factor RimP